MPNADGDWLDPIKGETNPSNPTLTNTGMTATGAASCAARAAMQVA
jgi:hypothetical protein